MIIGPQHGPPLPSELSRSGDKLDLYAADTFFVESWEDLLEVAGEEACRVADSLAGLTLKPDAIAARVARPTLRWLDEQGFSVVAARTIRFDRRMVRGVWGYSWNVATRSRKEIMELLMCSSPSLFVALRGPSGASALLSERKGPADPPSRKPGHLRHLLASDTALLNYVHTADEPADLIRELGVCFDACDRRAIYAHASSPDEEPERVEVLVEELESALPVQDLRLAPAVERLLATLERRRDAASCELRAHLTEAMAGQSLDWRATAPLIDRLDPAYPLWDRIVIATHLIQTDTGIGEPLIASIASSPVAERRAADTA